MSLKKKLRVVGLPAAALLVAVRLAAAEASHVALHAAPNLEMYDSPSAENAPPGPRKLLLSLEQRFGGLWEVRWDRRAGRAHLIQGSGIPLVPGAGNNLKPEDVGLAPGEAVKLEHVDARARLLLADSPWLLDLPAGDEWKLVPEASAGGPDPMPWLLTLMQAHAGVPVDGARVFLRVAGGNLVQFGASRVADVVAPTQPLVGGEQALDVSLAHVGVARASLDALEGPELKLFPGSASGDLPGPAYDGPQGLGYAHRLAWEWRFSATGRPESYRARVDALTGAVLEVHDLTMYDGSAGGGPSYGRVRGGVFPRTHTDPQVNVGLPYVRVEDVMTTPLPPDVVVDPATVPLAATFSSAAGFYPFYALLGNCFPLSERCDTPNAALLGQYVGVTDRCGASRQYFDPWMSDGVDVIDFGVNTGFGCATPGHGGAGNTASARNVYYHLTNIHRDTAAFPGVVFPATTTAWLASTLPAVVHSAERTCNAGWHPLRRDFTFYNSDGLRCADLGQVSDVVFHEWGHGFYQSAHPSPFFTVDKGTGEAFADTIAFLRGRDGCIGESSWLSGSPCYECRATCARGVRDVEAFAAGRAVVARPISIASTPAGPRCDRLRGFGGVACPYIAFNSTGGSGGPYQGPMGYEGHCESYIASGATWDVRRELSLRYGDEQGWEAFASIWHKALVHLGAAYRLADGEEQCNTSARVDGCSEENWYNVLLVADDDDGNLATGTPNACRIWDAFDAHGIACGPRPLCTR